MLAYKGQQAAQDLQPKMESMKILFNVEPDAAGYLGALIGKNQAGGAAALRQSGLAKRVAEAMRLGGSAPPAGNPAKEFLPAGKLGEPAHGEYSYASAAGMLQHLQGIQGRMLPLQPLKLPAMLIHPSAPMK